MRFFAVFLLSALAFAEQSRVSQQGAHRMEISSSVLNPGLGRPSTRPSYSIRTTGSDSNSKRISPDSSTSPTSAPPRPTRCYSRASTRVRITGFWRIGSMSSPRPRGAFRVDGPAGYDVVAWMISPVELGRPETPPVASMPPVNMTPRCDDTLFKARGECLDSSGRAASRKKERQ